MKEIWKEIKDFPFYEISNKGRIKSKERDVIDKNGVKRHKREKILKQHLDKDGYFCIGLYDTKVNHYNKRVNILVAEAFILNPNNFPIINHKDENKQNNDMNNLEWCTYKYNINYGTTKEKLSNKLKLAFKFRRSYCGEKNPNSKLKDYQRNEIKEMRKQKYTLNYIAKKYEVSISTISKTINRKG